MSTHNIGFYEEISKISENCPSSIIKYLHICTLSVLLMVTFSYLPLQMNLTFFMSSVCKKDDGLNDLTSMCFSRTATTYGGSYTKKIHKYQYSTHTVIASIKPESQTIQSKKKC